MHLDHRIFVLLNEHLHNALLDAIMPRLTNAQKTIWFWILVAPLLVRVWQRGERLGRTVLVLLALLLPTVNFVSSDIVKPLFNRPRPTARMVVNGVSEYVVSGARLPPHSEPLGTSSFPSSHSAVSAALATTLILAYRRRTRRIWFALLIPIIIGWSRIYVGVHYPSDVLGGWLLGTLLAATAWKAVSAWQARHSLPQTESRIDGP